MDNQVQLYVNGNIYETWKSVNVEASLEAACRTFSLSVTESIPKKPEAGKIKPGSTCVLKIG